MNRRELLQLGIVGATAAFSSRAFGDPPGLLAFGERPQELSTPLSVFDRLITPTESFFIRSHFGPPALDPSRRVRIGGLVRTPLALTAADLARFEEVTTTAVLQCAGNGRGLMSPRVPGVQWDHGAVGQATWTGVRLRDVLTAAGYDPSAAHVHLGGADLPPKPTVPAYRRSIPLARALDETTLIAYRMNGEPLRLAHGAPLRLVVPGWAANHWFKWLVQIDVSHEPAPGFYNERGYRMPTTPVTPGTALTADNSVPLTVFPVKSVIARPSEGERVTAGPHEIVGVAYSGGAVLHAVEVQIDDGPFRAARLEGEPGAGRWQVFRAPYVATPGPHHAVVRATDASGATQPETPLWNPSGYFWNAWHRVRWDVA